MALEVGRLVARLELEGSFAAGLAKARADLEAATAAARDLDSAMSIAGRSGKGLDQATKSAKDLDTALDGASKKGRNLDISDRATAKLVKLQSTTRDYGVSLKSAADAGRNLDVSDKASGKLVKLQSTTRDYGVALKSATDAGRNLDVSDTASGKLTRMQSTAREYEGALQKASNTGRSLDVNDAATGKLSSMSSMADQLSDKLQSAGVSMGALMGAAAGGTAVGAVLTKGWDRFTAIDDAQKKLSGLGHETQAVAGIMDSALSSVRGTAYGLGDAATISASAVAAGIQPGKDLTKYLTMTGDAAAIAGVDLSQMGRIINQVQTAQVAYTGDLNQLADRGLPVYQWLAEEAGVTGAEIKKMASTGQISSEMLFNAIQKNIGGAAKEMGDSVTGSISNMGAAIGRLGESVITPFKGAITGALSSVTSMADGIGSAVAPAFNLLGSAVSGAVRVFASLPGPVQAVTAAFVAMRVSAVASLVATLRAGLATAVAAAATGMSTLAFATMSYTMRAASAVAATGTLRGAMATMGASAVAAGRGMAAAFAASSGPLWLVAGAVAGVVTAYRSMKSAQEAYAAGNEIVKQSQAQLVEVLGRTANTVNEEVTQAMIDSTQSVVESSQRMAEEATGAWNFLDGPMHRIRNNYDALRDSVQNQAGAQDYAKVQSNMARLEMQALGDATEAAGVKVEDAGRIALQGGSQWEQLKSELYNTGSAGEAMAAKLEASAEATRRIQRAAEAATDGSMQLSEAFEVMADTSASAEEKARALMNALDALNGGQMAADDAVQAHNDSIRELVESLAEGVDPAQGFGDALYDAGNRIDTTTANGSKLRDALKGMTEDMVQVASSGGDLAGAWERNEQGLQALADAYGIPLPKMRELAAEMGLIPDVINTAYALEGADAATQEMAALNYLIQNSPDGEVVIGKDQIAESRGLLEELGFKVTSLPDGNVRVEAESEQAQTELQGIMNIANTVGSMEEAVTIWTNANVTAEEIRAAGFEATVLPDGSVDVSSNSPQRIAEMQALGYNVNMLPDGNIMITDTSAENMARLANLGIQTVTLPDGRVVVTDTSDENRARLNDLGIKTTTLPPGRVSISDNVPEVQGRINTLKTNTSSTHNVYVVVNRSYSETSTGGTAVGHHYGADGGIFESYAQGGISRLERYANGGGSFPLAAAFDPDIAGAVSGTLPSSARIQAPRGKRGLVQWAEDETEGEAFIPLARSKRKRSRDIWIETGKRLGMLEGKGGDIGGLVAGLGKFADGGIMAGGLIDFAKGVEGKPYVWGGVNWGDCCLVPDSMIWGPNGAKPIAELKAGDLVYSFEDGKLTVNKVTAQWFSKRQETFKVRTRRRSIVGSDNHPFMRLVISEPSRHLKGEGSKGKQTSAKYDVEFARLDQLNPGDLLVQPKDAKLDFKGNTLPSGRELTLNEAWLLGVIIGDGSVQDTQVEVCVYGDLRERVKSVAATLPLAASGTRSARTGAGTSESESHGVRIHSTEFARELDEAGFRKPAHEKHIPDCVWGWDADHQRAFLNGYCDADGHHPANMQRHGERTISSCSRRLVDDARTLHIILGDQVTNITVNHRRKPVTINGTLVKNARPLYTFGVSAKHDCGGGIAANLARPGIRQWIEDSDFTLARVIDVTPQGVQDTYDIEVEGAHNFIADGVVVHNSGAVSAIANWVAGRSPFGSRFATGNEREALAERGFVNGRGGPGDLRIGWFNGGPYGGHTAATLPNGVNFEMGGGRGNGQYGGPAAGADDPQFTDHAHFPMERFADIDKALGQDAEGEIYRLLGADGNPGAGNPEMASKPDTRTPREKNIDAIVAEGQRRNLSDRDIQIALMTAEQESGIRVLNNPNDPESMNRAAEGTGYDGTSTGIFQQQNNGAWGTLDDRMDPTKSAGMFYDQLEKVEGRDGMAMTAVAQKVQGSAHPDAYAKWEGKSGEELAASKKRLTELKSQASGGGGDGARVFVTNWPGGGASSFDSSARSAISDAEKAVGDAEEAAFIKDASIAAMFARQAGQTQLIQKESKGAGGVTVRAFADGGFHGIENHSAHIAPAGSWRLFGEPETGGEAYIPLAINKRARSRDIWLETGRRLGYGALAGAMLGGSLLTGNGLDTSWGGPSLDDLGIDKKGLQDALQPGLNSKAEEFGMQVAAAAQAFLGDVQRNINGTLKQVETGKARARQQYSRAMI